MDLKNIQSELKSRVAKGLNFGVEAVEEVLEPSSELYNEYVLLKSKYNDLMYVSSLNTLPYEQIEIGLNRLRSHVLAIIEKLEPSDLKKQDVDSDLKIMALPTRRTNFFKLLDIHFNNLEAIRFIEIDEDKETIMSGREAIFNIYQMNRRRFKNREDVQTEAGLQILKSHFYELFSNETGMLEVYFKNIKHLLSYTLESEVERQFFLDTVKSLFSRFELALIFYYAICGVDPEFEGLVKKSRLIDGVDGDTLIVKNHLSQWR